MPAAITLRSPSRPVRWTAWASAVRVVLCALLLEGAWCGANPPSLETQVKAAFLTKLAMFVDWPPGVFPNEAAPVCIGILGEDPFGRLAEEAALAERVNGRRVHIRRLRDVKEVTRCQILFIGGGGEAGRLEEMLQALAGRPILTVGDQPDFTQRGGMVNFIKEEGRIRFEVNLAATDAAGLKLSAKFLQVARVVVGGRNGRKR
jgi:hypothetical protein